jgi:hypothetical protein
MAVVSQKTPNLLGGVSQQDERLRRENQASVQNNGLSDASSGLRKRPPSEYVALLDADVDAHDQAYIYTLDRDLVDKFRIIIRNGDLKAFDAITGAAVNVIFPEGKAYLSVGTGTEWRAVTVEDVTYIVNRESVVIRDPAQVSTTREPEALVYVRQGNEDTVYQVNVDGFTFAYTTPAVTTGDASPDTTVIAQAILDGLQALSGFTAVYTAERIGSALYVKRVDGADFEISTEDGLSDRGLLSIKNGVQSFDDLPPQAKDGFTVEVTGEPGTEFDNYWLTYQQQDVANEEEGVWIETLKPGSLFSFDNTTMPHQLVLRGGLTDEAISEGVPPLPSVTEVKGTQVTSNWEVWQKGAPPGTATPLGSSDQVALDNHNEYAEYTMPLATFGQETDTVLRADIFPQPASTDAVKLIAQRDDGTTVTTLQTFFFPVGTAGGQIMSFSWTPNAGDKLRLTYQYNSGSTPASDATIFAFLGAGSPSDAINLSYNFADQVNFRSTQKYPGGYYIRVTIGATNFDHTPTNDETGTQVATAMQALIDADANWQAAIVSPGVLLIQSDPTGGSPPNPTITLEFDPTKDVWLPDIDMTGLNLIGQTVQNITDGSSGVVTAQLSSTTLQLSSGLTGGTDNTFEAGDLIDVSSVGTFFVFKTVDWDDRDVGDDNTNPFPDFINRTLADVTFYQGRLGLIYQDRIWFSAAGGGRDHAGHNDLHKFFRHSARLLRDDDPIGAESALPQVASFDSAITWNKALYLRAENGFVLASGDPVLTPTSISMDMALELQSSFEAIPVVVGRSLFVARPRPRGQGIQIMEVSQVELDVLTYNDVTLHVPRYLLGTPKTIAGSGGLGLVFILPEDCTQNVLYVYSYLDDNRDRVLSSWSQWIFSPVGQILQIDIIDGTLGMVIKYPDGVYLETVALDEAI